MEITEQEKNLGKLKKMTNNMIIEKNTLELKALEEKKNLLILDILEDLTNEEINGILREINEAKQDGGK